LDFSKQRFSKAAQEKFLSTYKNNPELQAQLRENNDALLEEMLADELGNNFVDKEFWNSIHSYSKNLFDKVTDIAKKIINKITGTKYETFIPSKATKDLSKKFESMIDEIRKDVVSNDKTEDTESNIDKTVSDLVSYATRTKTREGVTLDEDGSVIINNIDSINMKEYASISSAMKRLGYDWRGAEDAKKLIERHLGTKWNGEQGEAIKKVLKLEVKELTQDEKKAEEIKKLITKAKRNYGTTNDYREGGYLLPDGTMLDFSGRRDGADGFGMRYMDHRQIEEVYQTDKENRTQNLYNFMNETGSVRLMNGDGYVGFHVVGNTILTAKQINAMVRMAARKEQLIVEYKPLKSYSEAEVYEEFDYPSLSQIQNAIKKVIDAQKNVANDTETKYSAREKQTQSEAFKKWFGNSKVVDENGEPLVVYHGTSKLVNAFDKSLGGTYTGALSAKEGFFFTDSVRLQILTERESMIISQRGTL
jgi:hypothetical protein